MRIVLAVPALLVVEQCEHVIPERIPLLLFVPYIRSLIQRDDVAGVQPKKLCDRARLRLHVRVKGKCMRRILRLTSPPGSARSAPPRLVYVAGCPPELLCAVGAFPDLPEL